ncbi:MAG: PAAR domain-containing protein [Acidobacteriaceae bacterium]|nr:PAAR domain-containing protein [Acidobacteriaceae bacterium]MBV9764374.1 PAAR domain-containing protein [Acidobacteriaceae bacterium]
MSWLVDGLLIGAAVAAAGVLIVGTGGLAAAAIVGGVAATGAGIGEVLSTMSWAPKDVVGAIVGQCSENVLINKKFAARAHPDLTNCCKHEPSQPPIAEGSATVRINGLPAARVSDRTSCSAAISNGSINVRIGGGRVQTDVIRPEDLVPGWVNAALFAAGLASAIILAGPVVAVAGLIGAYAGGGIGAYVGGEIWGEGSDAQKWATLGGSFVGGGLAAKGGAWFDKNYVITSEGLGSNFGNLRIRPRLPELDATGKVHGELPDYVPSNWTRDQLGDLKSDLEKSIEFRKQEQVQLGEDGPHRARINDEERLLRQINKKLSGS